jgi:hypothetical protein
MLLAALAHLDGELAVTPLLTVKTGLSLINLMGTRRLTKYFQVINIKHSFLLLAATGNRHPVLPGGYTAAALGLECLLEQHPAKDGTESKTTITQLPSYRQMVGSKIRLA